MPSGRMLIVSNRLPVSAQTGSCGVTLEPAGGGLATGLRPWHERSGGLWIGWPGDSVGGSEATRAAVDEALAAARIVPVYLCREHVDRYYHGFANRVLWPLFHYLIDRVPVHASGWDAYCQVNKLFADTVAGVYRDGDTIWVHDYQLMLVPALVRQRLPAARIGFFLHIPFPSSEVFRVLPWRREIVRGLLGADLIGFHTFGYMRHFAAALLHVDGLEVDIDRVRSGNRWVSLGVFPMSVDAYQRFRRQVEEAVGRINGGAGTLSSTPIHYLHRSLSMTDLVALYRAADVMLVTPLRDGMNLVAKECAASRIDGDGVLLLSEFAGAAVELDGPMLVNPYDVQAVADGLHTALTMPADERRARMGRMRARVATYDVHAWARDFLGRLEAVSVATASRGDVCRGEPALRAALVTAVAQPRVRLLLDYDGTLVPYAAAPGLARPDAELLALLDRLAALPGVTVAIVSGRGRESLEAWLGSLPVALWAEHGVWHRPAPGQQWIRDARISARWMDRIRPILEQFTASTPGSHLELKSASIAWHYRRAGAEFGARQAHELRMLLSDALSNQPLEVLEGNKVLEVRLRGISKAVAAHQLDAATRTAVIACGDDRTDEDLFRALPPSSVTIAVGRPCAGARYQVADHQAVRRLLHVVHTLRGGAQLPNASAAPQEERSA